LLFLLVIPEGDLLSLSLSLPLLLLLLLPLLLLSGCHPVRDLLLSLRVFARHPERSNSRTLRVAQSKDPDTLSLTHTPKTLSAHNSDPLPDHPVKPQKPTTISIQKT